MANCNINIVKDIVINCENPIVGGYTGRGVLIPYSNKPTIVTDSTNPRKVKSITLPDDAKLVVIDNAFAEPFTGSSTTGATDSGRVSYPKSIVIRIPRRGADVSKGLVEPLINNPLGFLLVLEKMDKVQDGGFEVVGLNKPAKADPSSVSRTETDNGGDITMNIVTSENWFESTFVGSGNDYATALTEFEELLDLGME